MSLLITCPNCGQAATIEGSSEASELRKLDPVAFVSPVGFRKIQIDWKSETVSLYCVNCAVPAEITTRH